MCNGWWFSRKCIVRERRNESRRREARLARERRTLCRACLDWSVRRNHLAGAVGAAVLNRCLDLGWARRAKDSRVVTFTAGGEKAFRDRFSLPRDASGARLRLPRAATLI